MIRIFESLQDVSDYLKLECYSDLFSEFGDLSKYNGTDDKVVNFIISFVKEHFPDEPVPTSVDVVVVKVLGDDTEVVSTDHKVVAYNGYYYDFTACQFNDEYGNLITEGNLPVIQPVITNDSQINDKVSTVKSYALVGFNPEVD